MSFLFGVLFTISSSFGHDSDNNSGEEAGTAQTVGEGGDPDQPEDMEEDVEPNTEDPEIYEFEPPIDSDSSINSISRYNFIFYFIYKYKYENRTGVDEIKALTID